MEQRPHMVSLSRLLLLGVLFGLSLTACVKLPHRYAATTYQPVSVPYSNDAQAFAPININTASAQEIERLPGIGRALAARIVSFREQYGRFRRAEHLIMVRGIGDRRFRRLRPFITVE